MMDNNDLTVHWSSGINLLAGVWLMLAPFALGYWEVMPVLWNDVIIGAFVAIFALFRSSQPRQFESLSWLNFVLGIWLIVAPFTYTYRVLAETTAMWNDILTGIVIIMLATWSAINTRNKLD